MAMRCFFTFVQIYNELPVSCNRIGQPLIQLHTVDSTNNYAIAKVHEGMAQHGLAVLADVQTQGRGQRSKTWQSEPGMNLLCSMVLEPYGLELQQSFVLSMTIALAVHAVFNNYAGNETAIKWPNDIMWRDRKAGGILIENVIQGGAWKWAVAGVGLNINQTEHAAYKRKAVSLKQITGQHYEVSYIAGELFKQVTHFFAMLQQQPQSIITQYHNQLYRRHQAVRLKKESRIFSAFIEGVAPNGALIARSATEEHFSVGEVEWMD